MQREANSPSCFTPIGIERELIELRIQISELRRQINKQVEPISTKGMNFGEALQWLKQGRKITRKCWRNTRVYVWLWQSRLESMAVPGCMDELRVKTIQGKTCPWMPNHQELLADDWELVL